jgi:formylglycine-generating enzyme required for sulfatase activity
MSRAPLCPALALALAAGLALPLLPAQPPAGCKYAVLVGVNRYEHPRLPSLAYAEADVTDLARVLGKAGYQFTLLTGAAHDDSHRPTKANIEKHLRAVLRGCKRGDTALVAFAGHGVQFEGQKDCYFCPQDARPFKDKADTLVSLAGVYAELDGSFAGMKVLLVDACRDDPDAGRGARGVTADSAPRPPQGVAALFSCRAGERAYESDKIRHGVFFYHVLQGLGGKARDGDGDVTFAGLAAYVSRHVAREVPGLVGGGARQSPNLKADYSTEPVLVGPGVERVVAEKPALARAPFGKTKARELQRAWAEYLGRKVEEEVDLGGGVKMQFVLIPPGTFTMGSSRAEIDQVLQEDRTTSRARFAGEKQHEVTISRPFYLGKYPVTRGQFRRFVQDAGHRTEAETDGRGGWGYNQEAGSFQGPNWDATTGRPIAGDRTSYSWRYTGFAQTDRHPVVNLSWSDARAFCRWLAGRSGRKARLPSEAEYEYACRAGTTKRYFFGDDPERLPEYANVADATLKRLFPGYTTIAGDDGYAFTAPVGSFRPNPFGLFDVHGNVGQWCADWYEDNLADLGARDPLRVDRGSYTARVLRGGSWDGQAWYSRSACRDWRAPAYRSGISGCRVAFRLD